MLFDHSATEHRRKTKRRQTTPEVLKHLGKSCSRTLEVGFFLAKAMEDTRLERAQIEEKEEGGMELLLHLDQATML